MHWQKESNTNTYIKALAFFLNPTISLFLALFSLKTKSSCVLLFAFFVTFGFSYTVSDVRTEENNLDGISYRNDFEEYANISSETFYDSLADYVTLQGGLDFYKDVVCYFVSRFTANYHVMFFVVSLVFSFFCLKSLKYFVTDKNFSNSIFCFILLYLFVSNQIFNINNFRFYTAAWIANFSLLKWLIDGNKKLLLLLFITPFFHGSFILIPIMVIIYLFFCKSYRYLTNAFVLSLVFSELSLEVFRNAIEYMPAESALALKMSVYTDENYVYKINEGGSGFIWVVRLLEAFTRILINVLVLVLIVNYNKYIRHTNFQQLFHFMLLIMIFANFTMFIPSTGNRFIILAMPLLAYIWLGCLLNTRNDKWLYLLGLLFVMQATLPFAIYSFPCVRLYFRVLESSFFCSSPLWLFLKYILWF